MQRLSYVPILLATISAPAFAQMMPGGPGMPPGGGMPGGMPTLPAPSGGGEEKEGPAEQAPEEPMEESTLTPPGGFSRQLEKRIQFLQLAGYFRFRTELWHNFHLGFVDPTMGTPPNGAPFQVPADCVPPTTGTNPRMESASRACDTNLSTTNMRFRLEPTINVSEKVRIKAQIDFLDNVILGSTPNNGILGTVGAPGSTMLPGPPPSLAASGLTTTQVPPQAGRNSLSDSVQVKRVWAEVETLFGDIRFGRMPNHFGMGMTFNDGGCLDCDFGSTIDRVSLSTKLANHTAAILFDWASTGPTSDRLAMGLNQYQGQPFDATNRDDVSQYGLLLGRFDSAGEWKERVDRGDTAWNYGLYFTYRSQELDESPAVSLGSDVQTVGQNLFRSNLSQFTPSVWTRLHWHHLLLELEGTLVAGDLRRPNPQRVVKLRQVGGVGRMTYSVLHDSIKLKFESGFASGDQIESPQTGQTNYLNQPTDNRDFPGDTTFTRFAFDPDYHVDLILFRRLIGTVANAIYAKPSLRYDLNDMLGAQLDIIAAFPHVPVATPGNGRFYGLEVDLGVHYQNVEEGFFASLEYGAFFPGSAMDQPNTGTPVALFPAGTGGASAAQTLRFRLGVKY